MLSINEILVFHFIRVDIVRKSKVFLLGVGMLQLDFVCIMRERPCWLLDGEIGFPKSGLRYFGCVNGS